MSQRLYKAEWINTEDVDEDMYEEDAWDHPFDPDGWAEFCEAKWGEYKPFFFPSTDRIFRSRSAAQRRVDIINHWGGHAVLMECTPQWETVAAANARRRLRKLAHRKARLQAQLGSLDDEICTEELMILLA